MSRTFLTIAVATTALMAADAHAGSVSADSTDAKAIMKAVEDRDIGKTLSAYAVMTISPTKGPPVKREMKSQRLRVGGDHRRFVVLAKPADVRNLGVLVYDYHDGAKPDDQWLYLPSIRKTTRIAGSDKAAAFLGSDFSYSDMTLLHASNYDFKLLKPSVTVNGEDCWLIEGTPKTKRVRDENGYAKSEFWVSKDKHMVVQQRAFVVAGKRMKLMKFENIKQFSGVWVAQRYAARTLSASGKPESTTILDYGSVVVNGSDLKESDFTAKRLEKGL